MVGAQKVRGEFFHRRVQSAWSRLPGRGRTAQRTPGCPNTKGKPYIVGGLGVWLGDQGEDITLILLRGRFQIPQSTCVYAFLFGYR